MFSIGAIIGTLITVSDTVDLAKVVLSKLRRLKPQDVYVDLLEVQFKSERSHGRLDIVLDKKKMKSNLRQASIRLKNLPLLPDQLNESIEQEVVQILLSGNVTSGSSDLLENRAIMIVRRVHQQYFEQIVGDIPELADVIQFKDVSTQLKKLGVDITHVTSFLENQARTLDRVETKLGQLQNETVSTKSVLQELSDTQFDISEDVKTSRKLLDEIKYDQEYGIELQVLMSNMMQQVLQSVSGNSSFANKFDEISADSPPEFGLIYSSRSQVVQFLENLFVDNDWVEITGQQGGGKTWVAATYFKAKENHTRWISFVGQTEDKAVSHLRSQLILWLQEKVPEYANKSIGLITVGELVKRLSDILSHGLIIFDDLPDPADPHNKKLYEELQLVAAKLHNSEIKVLSTGQRFLPNSVTTITAHHQYELPPLENTEIKEILLNADAPKFYVEDETVAHIMSATDGLPSLVAAYTSWYKREGWPEKQKFIETTFFSDPGRDLRREVQRTLSRLLQPPAVELLSRLSLLISDFDDEMMFMISQIGETIDALGLVFADLENVWVSKLDMNRYQVSPLVKDLGKKNLNPTRQIEIYSETADYYLREKQPISLDDVFNISLYLWSASRQSKFASFLTYALMQVDEENIAKRLFWASSMPSVDLGFSDEVSISLQILLRTQQLRLAVIVGQSTRNLSKELDRLISVSSDTDVGAVIYAYVMVTLMQTSAEEMIYPLEKSLAWTFAAIDLTLQHPNAYEQLRLKLGEADTQDEIVPDIGDANMFEQEGSEEFGNADSEQIGNIVWFWVRKIKSHKATDLFLEQIYSSSQEVRETIFEAPLAYSGLPFIVDELWLTEEGFNDETADHSALLIKLDAAIEFANNENIDALRVASSRAKAITLGEINRDVIEAIAVMDAIPESESRHEDLKAWIHITRGLLHNDYGTPSDARSHLEYVLASEGSIAEQWRMSMRKYLMVVYSKLGLFDKAKKLGIEALTDGETEFHPQYSRLEILGELAFVHYQSGDAKKACGSLYAYYTELKNSSDLPPERYNEAYNKFAHAMGWYASRNPERLIGTDGETDFPVSAGFFTRNSEGLRTYKNKKGNLLSGPAILLTTMSIDTNAHGIAWSLWNDVKNSPELENTFMKLFLYNHGASLESRYGDPTNAITYGIKSFKLKALTEKSLVDRSLDVFKKIDLDSQWDSLDSETQSSYETYLLYDVLIPAYLRLLSMSSTKNKVIKIMDSYRNSFKNHTDLNSQASFLNTIDLFEQTLLVRLTSQSFALQQTSQETIDYLLLFSTADINNGLTITEKLFLQAQTAVHIWESRNRVPHQHSLYEIGRFIHRFWTEVSRNQRFLLSNPNGFAADLEKVSPAQGVFAVTRVLHLAGRATKCKFPEHISRFIHEAS